MRRPLQTSISTLSSMWFLGMSLCLGCSKPAPPPNATKTVEVPVIYPTERKFTETEEFSGRLQAVDAIELRSRVTGYLDEVLFKDGADVDQGTPLFRIDARYFNATSERAAANIARYDAQIERLESQLNRAKKLVGGGAVSQEEVEVLKSQVDEAKAAKKGEEALKEMADLDVNYALIKAPIAGRISRRWIDAHSTVKADETSLAMLVSLNPIYAYFDVDERTVLRIRRLAAPPAGAPPTVSDPETTNKPDPLIDTVVQFSLTDEKNEFGIPGKIDFVDNQLDPSTGTLRVRAKIDNPKLFLLPGMFVRCRLPIGPEKVGRFVPEECLGSDQGQSFLYVVNDANKVQYRHVQLGPLESGSRAILSNLSKNDRVIVAGLQRVKPDDEVKPIAPKTEAKTNSAEAKISLPPPPPK